MTTGQGSSRGLVAQYETVAVQGEAFAFQYQLCERAFACCDGAAGQYRDAREPEPPSLVWWGAVLVGCGTFVLGLLVGYLLFAG